MFGRAGGRAGGRVVDLVHRLLLQHVRACGVNNPVVAVAEPWSSSMLHTVPTTPSRHAGAYYWRG